MACRIPGPQGVRREQIRMNLGKFLFSLFSSPWTSNGISSHCETETFHFFRDVCKVSFFSGFIFKMFSGCCCGLIDS
jgi:hypothetical protein